MIKKPVTMANKTIFNFVIILKNLLQWPIIPFLILSSLTLKKLWSPDKEWPKYSVGSKWTHNPLKISV